MYLIVGLGNPGEQYIGTRHNLGFLIVDELRRKLNLGEWGFDKKFNAEVVKTPELILVRPHTFMNNSGEAVSKIASFFKIESESIVIVNDELDLPLGKIKVRLGGAAAGHHGVESVMEKLGTDQFIRVRNGIGNNHAAEKFVMQKFEENEISEVKHLVKQALKALEILMSEGFEKAHNQYN